MTVIMRTLAMRSYLEVLHHHMTVEKLVIQVIHTHGCLACCKHLWHMFRLLLLISLLECISLQRKVKSFFVLTSSLFCNFAILDDETENTSKWKESLLARTLSRRSTSLMQLVYGQSLTKLDSVASKENDDSGTNSSDEEFFVPKGQKKVQVRCLPCLCVQYNLYFFFQWTIYTFPLVWIVTSKVVS